MNKTHCTRYDAGFNACYYCALGLPDRRKNCADYKDPGAKPKSRSGWGDEKRGGTRPGAGRPRLEVARPMVKKAYYFYADQISALKAEGEISKQIRKAIDDYLKTKKA